MDNQLILLLIASYLRKLINPAESDSLTASTITQDLKRFKTYLDGLDKSGIER